MVKGEFLEDTCAVCLEDKKSEFEQVYWDLQ